jgi:hypothetical protein
MEYGTMYQGGWRLDLLALVVPYVTNIIGWGTVTGRDVCH